MELAFATHQGRVRIGKWDMLAFNLRDGRRVLAKETFKEVLQLPATGGNTETLRKISRHPAMKNANLTSAMLVFESPIWFRSDSDKLVEGFEAEGLVTICKFLLKAREIGALRTDALMRTARLAESIIISLANVGLIAMIDEATGFQVTRGKEALQNLFDKFLRTDYDEWSKRFPDDFYIELFRLRGWPWKGRAVNPPQCVGAYTNQIVYQRLAPGVLRELEVRNPIQQNGERLSKHHQWLTDDIGHPALSHHIYALIALMRASKNWDNFIIKVESAFPQFGDQLNLGMEE